MKSIRIIAVGKLKTPFRALLEEYLKRPGFSAKIEIIEIEEQFLPEKPGNADVKKALDTEGVLILKKLPKNSFAAALCIEGKQLSSERLAALITEKEERTQGGIIFIIGSSYGLSENVKTAANLKLSLSEMTFPHQFARIMLTEQLYRAYCIKENIKYHK